VRIGRGIRSLEGRGVSADTESVRVRLSGEQGFGLIELLMSMVMLNIGILAIVAAFNSGIVTLNRASRISTAAALADAQMELYRALPYDSIGLDSTAVGAVDSTYKADNALASCAGYPSTTSCVVTTSCSGSPLPNECNPSRSVSPPSSPDRKKYRVDTYIIMSTATTTPPTPTSGRPVKIVTVVVRDPDKLSGRPFVREASTFDESIG
jgi:type II secretory pathway pseudopilin PulG